MTGPGRADPALPAGIGPALLATARGAIRHALGIPQLATPDGRRPSGTPALPGEGASPAGGAGSAPAVPAGADPASAAAIEHALAADGASFVTLHTRGDLHGCIGTLTPWRALGADVAANARAAATADPRFDPLTPAELPATRIEVSVLSPLAVRDAASEAEAIALLRPGTDGVVLRRGRHRATFLPAVWEQLPEPAGFLAALRRKAGIPAGTWDAATSLETYTVTVFAGGWDAAGQGP